MAKVYLESSDNNYIIASSNTKIFGTGRSDDTIIINSGVNNITIASTIEEVNLNGDISNYQFSQGFGSNINILDSMGNSVATLGSVDGKTISVGSQSFDIHYNNGVVNIGGVDLSSTPISLGGGVSSNNITISSYGYTGASDAISEIFTIIPGNYQHTIDNFDTNNDKLDFGDYVNVYDISLINSSSDGMISLSYSQNGEEITTIDLTGLSEDEDLSLTTSEGLANILLNANSTTGGDFIDTTTGGDFIDTDDYVYNQYGWLEYIGDAGDFYTDATYIELTDGSAFITGYVDNVNNMAKDDDYYSFITDKFGTLSINLNSSDINFSDMDLALYNEYGEMLDASVNIGNSESLEYYVAPGEYYIVGVSEYENNSAGYYNLDINLV